ncbi:hypothetical protein DVH24_034907 [Malus domestica]|uniref:Uncharacterized protein n=2 Tax=Malus TaxID=3749 RepID=A0A498IDG0_MALDO|nr:hypothetical protein DVH24_034907 [Malus domestica]
MSKRHNTENMSLSSNLEALDIVVLVCRSSPKDLAASFTEENGCLGHINAIKQFLCLSLLHSCALTIMAISQLDYSIFTSLLSKSNQELCNRVDVHQDAVCFPNCIAKDHIFQQPGWCHTLTDPCDNISYQRVVINQSNKFNQRNYTTWLMERTCVLISFNVVDENGKRKGFGVGRTARAGQYGLVTSMYTESNRDLVAAVRRAGELDLPVFGQIVLLLVQIVTTMIRLLEEYANLKGLQDGHSRQEAEVFAILSHKHRNDPLKIKEIISMVANSLTSFLNLEIEFKFPLKKDGTTTASILILFF